MICSAFLRHWSQIFGAELECQVGSAARAAHPGSVWASLVSPFVLMHPLVAAALARPDDDDDNNNNDDGDGNKDEDEEMADGIISLLSARSAWEG